MPKPKKLRGVRISIQNTDGEFVPIGRPLEPRRIRCEPVPGRHGIDYVQDWSQLTRFG